MSGHSRRGAITITTVCAAVLLAATALGGASTAIAKQPDCAGAKPLVADATLKARNVDDVAVGGHVWALDAYTERIRIWQVGTNHYCVRRDAVGTFTSFAGISPGGTGTISAGVTGSLVGTQFMTFTGEFSPRSPTSGYIGEFDAGCNQQGVCANHDYRVGHHYFSGGAHAVHFGWFSFTYDAGAHGTFIQSTDGNSGDITG